MSEFPLPWESKSTSSGIRHDFVVIFSLSYFFTQKKITKRSVNIPYHFRRVHL